MEDGVRALETRGIEKRFGSVRALSGFDLQVRRGSIMALLGPSGCGKTTALRVIAGLERPDAGEVEVGGLPVAGPGHFVRPEDRRVGMVFQDWALFPHLTVWQNVAFGLPPGAEERVRETLTLVRLESLEDRMPHELSGGQQQRVAVARALAPSPEVILLDEPFSNLDAPLRSALRAEVHDVLRAARATAVFVTHDQEEALAIADEVAVMSRGRILQTGSPPEVYEAPSEAEVASLVGDVNLVAAVVSSGMVETPLGAVPVAGEADGPVRVLIRPESIQVTPDPAGRAVVSGVEFYGHDQMVAVRLPDGRTLRARPFGSRPDLHEGGRVRLALTGSLRIFRK
ncbi:MAG: ABC transporter ATP-binding protein [Actinomycetota bacterium]